jgi:predicted ATPase
MFLDRITIRHYKSLDSVQVTELTPVTVLVGSNAVGKSNFVDALVFVRDMVVHGLDHAVSTRGGITRVRQYARRKPFQVSIRLEFTQTTHEGRKSDVYYEIVLASLTEGNYRIESESGSFYGAQWMQEDEKDEPVEIEIRKTFKRDSAGQLIVDKERVEKKLRPDQIALGYAPGWPYLAYPIARFLSKLQKVSLYPNTLRELSLPDTDHALKEDGKNWASVLKNLRKTAAGKRTLERIKEMMQVVMPTLQDVLVSTAGSYLVPKFRFKDDAAESSHDFDPAQLSDGTLRIFGMLLALYQNPAPSLIVLEEPEQTVHPGVLGMLAEAFREVSERTQIIITSHSPYLVDHFDPEQVRVVSMHAGKTQIFPIQHAQVEAVKRQLMSLQDFMLAEGLLPEQA